MSSTARPISPTKFAEALKDLPASSIFAKASELTNSNNHLQASNNQLKEFADQGDKECADAIAENEEVIRNNEYRILMCRFEVETNRGMIWMLEGDEGKGAAGVKQGPPASQEHGQNGADGGVYL